MNPAFFESERTDDDHRRYEAGGHECTDQALNFELLRLKHRVHTLETFCYDTDRSMCEIEKENQDIKKQLQQTIKKARKLEKENTELKEVGW